MNQQQQSVQKQQHQFGMYSKAGQVCAQRFLVLSKKDEILNPQSQKKKIPQLQELEYSQISQTTKPEMFQKIRQKMSNLLSSKNSKKNQHCPWSTSLSREYVDRIKSNLYPPPPVGHYHPKYDQIDKATHYVWDIKKVHANKTERRTLSEIPQSLTDSQLATIHQQNDNSTLEPLPEKKKPKVKGFINFQLQTNRSEFQPNTDSPHEKRFISFHETERKQNFSIGKLTDRGKHNIYESLVLSPDYAPNFEQGKKRLAVSLVPFTKMLPRRVYSKPNATSNENLFNYDFFAKEQAQLGKSQLFKKIPALKLEKQLPREADLKSKLPSFMQKTMTGRMTLNSLSQKTLEQNNFSEGPCQQIISSLRVSKVKTNEKMDAIQFD